MPVLVNTISTQESFIGLVERALSEYPPVKHSRLVSEQWNADTAPLDILLIDSPEVFRKVITHYGNDDDHREDDPVVIFVSDRETIAEAVIDNVCHPLTIQYIESNGLTAKSLHKCIQHAAQLTRNRRALDSDQRHYRSLFEHVLNPAFILDNKWEFVKVNPAFEEYFNHKQPRIDPTRFQEIFTRSEDFQRIADQLKEHPDRVVNEVIRLKSTAAIKGTLVRVQLVAIREIVAAGKAEKMEVTGYNGSFQDVTEIKFTEDLQTRIDNLAMTYRLSRRLAHEIRNPLTNVTLSLDQLKVEMGNTTEDGGKIYFEIIERSVKRIGDLLEQMLQGAEPKQLQLQETDVVSLLRSVLRSKSDLFDLHHITVEEKFETEMFWIYLDKDKFTRAISHLINNAIEAIGQKVNGVITIGSCIEGDQFIVYIQDNGVGISEDVKAKLFTPFFTSKNRGIGFGLTSTQSILAEHGALMDVKSEKGEGTIFSIGFPLSGQKKTGS